MLFLHGKVFAMLKKIWSKFNGSFGDNIEYVKVYAISGSADIEYTLINS